MKRQSSFWQRGFTMIEIMLVIALIAMFFAFTSRFTLAPQQNITKAERLANKIQSIIQASSVAVMMGRMDQNQIATTGAILTFSTSTGISWRYTDGLSGSLTSPFFDRDTYYEISQIRWRDAGTTSGTGNFVQIDMAKWGNSFTGGTIPPSAVILEIESRYNDMYKKVIYDRRTGRTEINKK